MSASDLEDDRWVNSIIKELEWSADARGMLFASGVVLVEGETELAALPIWFAKSDAAHISGCGPMDLHIAFLSVGGDTAFGSFLFYLERFGVPWTVVCDGAAFRLDTTNHILEQVMKADPGNRELQDSLQELDLPEKKQADMSAELFQSMVDIGHEHGVFTLASGWSRKSESDGDNESFESFVLSRTYLWDAFARAKEAAGRSKPRVGRLLADATDCPSEVSDLYGQILNRLRKQGMRQLSARLTSDGKPSLKPT
jgi:hypothetical protein